MKSTNDKLRIFLDRLSLLSPRSLLHRFFYASMIILPLFILLGGTILLNTFQHSQLNAEKEKLQTQLYLLMSVTELDGSTVLLPAAFAEPLLNQPQSGLYARIIDNNHQEIWRSPSAQLFSFSDLKKDIRFTLNQRLFEQQLTSNNTLFNQLSYDTEWVNENNKALSLRFIIIRDAAPMSAELKSYQSRLWQWLGLMGIALIIAQVLIMRWGLQPLSRLSTQLQQLKNNTISQLSDNYPTEIQPIINNFNVIFTHEKKQRERYKNTMADLAHSVKTPLAVIQSQMAESEKKDPIMNEQLQRIDQIIGHQLQRAVVQINKNPINKNANPISIKTSVDRLFNIMNKVYKEKNMVLNNLCNDDSVFAGEEADLLEVLGNIIDNACKHGKNTVTVTAEHTEKQLKIGISDNGNGIADNLKKAVLQRGIRADTAQAGQGLGLSVCVEIVSSYQGDIKVSNNISAPHLSGACFQILFNDMQKTTNTEAEREG